MADIITTTDTTTNEIIKHGILRARFLKKEINCEMKTLFIPPFGDVISVISFNENIFTVKYISISPSTNRDRIIPKGTVMRIARKLKAKEIKIFNLLDKTVKTTPPQPEAHSIIKNK